MNKLVQSMWVALLLVVLIIVAIAATFKLRTEWWMFIDIFFAFMMVFTHLMALMVAKINKASSALLDKIALVCGVLFVVAFIVEFVMIYV